MTATSKWTPEVISSDQNSKFKIWKSLLESKGIKKQGQALLSGSKLVREHLATNQNFVCEVVHEKMQPLSKQNKKIFILQKTLFEELDINKTGSPLLVVNVPTFPTSVFQDPKGIEVIAPLQDPRNLGALIRSCAAFGVKTIHLLPAACHPYHPKALKVAANGFHHVQFFKAPSWDKMLDLQHGPPTEKTYILDANGTSIKKIKRIKNIYLIVGEEGQGLPQKFHETFQIISIPIQNIESLNATVATSIALYQLSE